MMTYTFKLSRRLARLKLAYVLLGCVGAAAACSIGDAQLLTDPTIGSQGSVDTVTTPPADTVSSPPPPTSRPVAKCANAPGSYVLITDQQWAHGLPPYTTDWHQRDVDGWYTSQKPQNASVQNGILTIKFPATLSGGTSPTQLNRHLSLDGARDNTVWRQGIYGCQQIRVRTGFSNSGNAETKWLHFRNSTVFRGGTTPKLPGWTATWTTFDGGNLREGTKTTGDNSLGVNLSRNMLVNWSWSNHYDEWHEFEWQMTPNAMDQADGTLRFWIDGQLADTLSDVRWYGPGIDPAVEGWNAIVIEPIYGGGPNSPVHDMYVDVGRTLIRAK